MNLNDIFWLKEGSVDLLVETYANIATIVQIRGLTDNEMVIHDHTTTSDRALASSVVGITAAPRFLTARCATSGIKRGQIYVRVSLRVEGVIVATLIAGYVDETSEVAYPNGDIQDAKSGRGHVRSITGTDPAAGAEFSETVPTGALWRLMSLYVDFQTDATVATRQCIVLITDGTNTKARSLGTASATAGATFRMTTGAHGVQFSGTGNAAGSSIDQWLLLPAGYQIQSSTINIQAGDNYSAPQLLVEEWMNP